MAGVDGGVSSVVQDLLRNPIPEWNVIARNAGSAAGVQFAETFASSLPGTQLGLGDIDDVVAEIVEFGLSYLMALEFRAGAEFVIQITGALKELADAVHARFQ